MAEPAKTMYVTGLCMTGACEGSMKKSESGAIFPQCKGTYMFYMGGTYKEIVCQHDCHAAFAAIRALMVDMPVPDGVPAISLPSTSVPAPTDAPSSESLIPFAVPMSPALTGIPSIANRIPVRMFTPTPSGRAARGQLEEQVRLQLAKAYGIGPDLLALTGLQPKLLAASINPEKPPSQGAVYAVFKRWEGQGWVELAEKPFRLVKVTEAGKRKLIY